MAATVLKPISLQIISDSICPFCYIGYKQITLAIAAAKKENLPIDFKLRFKPFLLDPSLSVTAPQDKRKRFAEKFGAARAEGIESQMKARGKSVGIDFAFGGTIRQTTDSHRLLAKAYAIGGEPAQRAVAEALFAGYFEHEQDIGSHEFLAASAVKAGVFGTEAEATTWLAGSEEKDGVQKDIMQAMRLGVSGVPFVILDDKYAVSGAQGEETFLEIFRKLATGNKLAVESDDGDLCE
ncbi:thioredoxin-like protein [Mycena albidolilacea]|uniref:Thioredoxin-like protein n=1 Tax=Mycena albidolilacea TaxID=1033008 RepID=A0AAD6ZSS8_9AGAR|nr:thioredoxin-like protein [Mycena albidolilacea]